MTAPSGKRDQLITIERATVSTDPYGEETEIWATYTRAWAQVFYGRGDERRQAAMEQGNQAATFLILANSRTRTLTVRDRIVFEGIWDIGAVVSPKPGDIEITAVRAK